MTAGPPRDPHAPLRENVKLLGKILGDVIRRREGDSSYEIVEALRGIAKQSRLQDEASVSHVQRELAGLQLDEGSSIQDIEIPLEAGARLQIHYTGPAEYAHVRVLCDGALIAHDGLRSGSSLTCTVPAREVEVQLTLRGQGTTKRRLQLQAGEELETTFELD